MQQAGEKLVAEPSASEVIIEEMNNSLREASLPLMSYLFAMQRRCYHLVIPVNVRLF